MKTFSIFLLAVMVFASCQSNKKPNINIDSVASPKDAEVFQPDWDNIAQHYQFPEWFCDAKFGIFIHWGVYAVPVAEHHDGFSMYDSDLNEWNAAKMGPKKDIVGLLKQAVEREGMVFGLSTHRAENAWFYNDGMTFPMEAI